jgi:hypothetical protein
MGVRYRPCARRTRQARPPRKPAIAGDRGGGHRSVRALRQGRRGPRENGNQGRRVSSWREWSGAWRRHRACPKQGRSSPVRRCRRTESAGELAKLGYAVDHGDTCQCNADGVCASRRASLLPAALRSRTLDSATQVSELLGRGGLPDSQGLEKLFAKNLAWSNIGPKPGWLSNDYLRCGLRGHVLPSTER